MQAIPFRRIRSYVLRCGRITKAQSDALENLWPIHGLDPLKPFDPLTSFPRSGPVILEIGFGNGESLARMAQASPDANFLGVEVHSPGVGHLLLRIAEMGLDNLKIYCADAVEILGNRIPDASLAGVQVFFPDPWHKKRHHKRRLINDEFASLVVGKLQLGGFLHCATDWQPYAEQMMEVLQGTAGLVNSAGSGQYCERPEHRPITRFESRGQKLGHGVWDLRFERA